MNCRMNWRIVCCLAESPFIALLPRRLIIIRHSSVRNSCSIAQSYALLCIVSTLPSRSPQLCLLLTASHRRNVGSTDMRKDDDVSPESGRVTIEKDVAFGTGGGRELKCNIYRPPDQRSHAPS